MRWKKILFGTWNWQRPIYSFISIYFLLAGFAYFFADHMIFLPPPPSYTKDYPNLDFIKTSEDESIAHIHLTARPGSPTVIYSHGNAEDLAASEEFYFSLHRTGIGIIAYDYPGYGRSTGKPSELSTQRAVLTMWKYALSSGIPKTSLFIMGRSVGSGPSTWLASQVKPAGLILISPFKSTYTTAFDLPFSFLPKDRFPNLRRIKYYHQPFLIIHGDQDEIIPSSHSHALFTACPSPDKSIQILLKGDHNSIFTSHSPEIIHFINRFTTDYYK